MSKNYQGLCPAGVISGSAGKFYVAAWPDSQAAVDSNLNQADASLLSNACRQAAEWQNFVWCGVFAEKFNGNRAAISSCTFLITVLSMLTIPLVVSAL